MKNYLTISLLFLSISCFAQEPIPVGKGVTPINNQQSAINNQKTYAVVVGIPDLRFVDNSYYP